MWITISQTIDSILPTPILNVDVPFILGLKAFRLGQQIEYVRLNIAVNPMWQLRSTSSLMLSRVDLLYLWKATLTTLLWQKHSDFWVCDVGSCTLADGWSSFIRKWQSCSVSVSLWIPVPRVFASGSSFASGSKTKFCTYLLVQQSNIYNQV